MDDEELNQLFGLDGEGEESPDTDKSEDKPAGGDGFFAVVGEEEQADTEDPDKKIEPEQPEKQKKTKKPKKTKKDKKAKKDRQETAPVRQTHEWFDEEPDDVQDEKNIEGSYYEDVPEEEPVAAVPEVRHYRKSPISAKGVILTLFALLVIAGIVLVFTLDSFKIKTINVEGNYVFSDEELIELSGIRYDSHLFFANYSKAARTIRDSSPYVRDCTVSFTFPSTVNINVEERSKIAYVKTPDGYAALDDQGIVLELSSFDSEHKVAPVISGLNITHASLGKEIVIGNYSDYQKSLIVMGSLIAADTNNRNGSYSIFENTEEVRVLPSGYIFLTIRLPNKNLLQVKFDSLEKISTQTAWLLYAIDAKVFEHGFANGSLDMTRDEPIYRQFVIDTDTADDSEAAPAGGGDGGADESGRDN